MSNIVDIETIKALQQGDHDAFECIFNAYLHTIARNTAINFLKRKFAYDNYVNSIDVNSLSPTSEEELIAKELGLLIDSVVENMPEQRQNIYILTEI